MPKEKKQALTELERLVDLSKAAERVMLERLIVMAKDFYSKPENLKAFEEWQAKRQSKKG